MSLLTFLNFFPLKLTPWRVDGRAPIDDALEKRLDVDVFLVLTFKLRNFEPQNSIELLDRYRIEKHTPYTKIIACGFTQNKLSEEFQSDLDSLFTVCGYDENVPDYLVRISKMMGITKRQPNVDVALSNWQVG